VWDTGCIDPLVGDEWSASRPGRLTPGERAPGTHWIGGWVGSRASLDDVEKRKLLTLPGLELWLLSRPAHSQSLYWLRYPVSTLRRRNVVKVKFQAGLTSALNGGQWSRSRSKNLTRETAPRPNLDIMVPWSHTVYRLLSLTCMQYTSCEAGTGYLNIIQRYCEICCFFVSCTFCFLAMYVHFLYVRPVFVTLPPGISPIAVNK
jgi:hypothetical protein